MRLASISLHFLLVKTSLSVVQECIAVLGEWIDIFTTSDLGEISCLLVDLPLYSITIAIATAEVGRIVFSSYLLNFAIA